MSSEMNLNDPAFNQQPPEQHIPETAQKSFDTGPSDNKLEEKTSNPERKELEFLKNICPICYESKTLLILHGSCSFCENCVHSHIISSLQSDSFRAYSTNCFQCPTIGCLATIPFNQVLVTSVHPSAGLLNEHLTMFYAQQTPDVICCPNSQCKYAGYYTSQHAQCQKSFICELCQTQILHPIIVQTNSKDNFKGLLTDFVKAFTTKRCPNCKIQITKNGGCNHMLCEHCKTEFNWDRVSSVGWRIIRQFVLLVTALVGWLCKKELLSFMIMMNPYVVQVVTIFLELFILVALLLLHFLYVIWLMSVTRKHGSRVLVGLLPLPIIVDVGLYYIFPSKVKTIVLDSLILLGFIYLISLCFSCIGWVVEFGLSVLQKKARMRMAVVVEQRNAAENDQLDQGFIWGT